MVWDICGGVLNRVRTESWPFNRIVVVMFVGSAVISGIVLTILWQLTKSYWVVFCAGSLIVALAGMIIFLIVVVRKKIVVFVMKLCYTLDEMLNDTENLTYNLVEETLFSKVNYRLKRLYEAQRQERRRIEEERRALQELISDIAHQVKTPIANLKMINSILQEETIPKEKKQELLVSADGQIDRLDFCMQAMIKTSRLETGVITLEKKLVPIYNTIASALGGILLEAEKKQLAVHVECNENLMLPHDIKWTTEAIFNILDNAVKYTSAKGKIDLSVTKWECYTRIDIKDNGRGIAEKYQAEIFKRFYREEAVHDIQGIGIGLFLAREIITMQGGYIKVASEVGKGSQFTIFLPNNF